VFPSVLATAVPPASSISTVTTLASPAAAGVHPTNVTRPDAISPVPGGTPPVLETVFHVVQPPTATTTATTIPPNTVVPAPSSLLKGCNITSFYHCSVTFIFA